MKDCIHSILLRLFRGKDLCYQTGKTDNQAGKLWYLSARREGKNHLATPLLVPQNEPQPGQACQLRNFNREQNACQSLVPNQQPRPLKGSEKTYIYIYVITDPKICCRQTFLGSESVMQPSGTIVLPCHRRSCPDIILAVPRLVQRFELLPPPGTEKLDMWEEGEQFSLHVTNHSVVVAKRQCS